MPANPNQAPFRRVGASQRQQYGTENPDDNNYSQRLITAGDEIQRPGKYAATSRQYSHKTPKNQPLDLSQVALTATDGSGKPLGVKYEIVGTWIACLWSTNLTDLIYIRFNDDSDYIPFPRGQVLGGIPFQRIYVWIPAVVAGATFYLTYATDAEGDRIRVD